MMELALFRSAEAVFAPIRKVRGFCLRGILVPKMRVMQGTHYACDTLTL
jgi:hypothetical protein